MKVQRPLALIRILFFIPSFYGFLMWGIAWFAYELRLVPWDRSATSSQTIFLVALIAYGTSLLSHIPAYAWWLASRDRLAGFHISTPSSLSVGLLHLAGFLGLALYWRALTSHFGSIEAVLLVLLSESHLVRSSTAELATIGVQISYLGWLAIALSLVRVVRTRTGWLWIAIALLQLVGNLTFVDRTRPVWIVIVAVLTCMAMDKGQLSKAPQKVFGGLLVLTVSAFLLVGYWVGKIGGEAGAFGVTALEGMGFSFYLYLTGGLAYANELLTHASAGTGLPERLMYPVFKLLSDVGLVGTPPRQINELLFLPYPTNVGTFLEPFYSDGGLPLTLLGIFVCTFGFDFFGLVCLRSLRPLAVFFWAHLCFTSLIAFFTPKIGTTPFWLFLALAMGSLVLGARQRSDASAISLSSR